MSGAFPPNPFLPEPTAGMDWSSFSGHGKSRDAEFYLTALQYGHSLWQRGFAARSLLCMDRAFGADLLGNESILKNWPLPYQATAWILAKTPPGVFIGNPRVHFQHYADRVNPPRQAQRRWRAWACWEIARVVMPHLEGDPKHAVEEPSRDRISMGLKSFGHPGETELWTESLKFAASLSSRVGGE